LGKIVSFLLFFREKVGFCPPWKIFALPWKKVCGRPWDWLGMENQADIHRARQDQGPSRYLAISTFYEQNKFKPLFLSFFAS
jgi:hypothetical protein